MTTSEETRVIVCWTMARRDANGELDPDATYEEFREFPNVVAARRWATNYVRAGKTDLGSATVHQQARDDYGCFDDVEEPEVITVWRRVRR